MVDFEDTIGNLRENYSKTLKKRVMDVVLVFYYRIFLLCLAVLSLPFLK
jgi:hypothetical protein